MGTLLANTLLAALVAVLASGEGARAGPDLDAGPTALASDALASDALASDAAPLTAPAVTADAGESTEPSQAASGESTEPSQADTGPPAAADDCLNRTIDALQTRYEKVRDVRAHFVQTTRAAHTGGTAPAPVRSSGHMVVQKPAKMRWVYEEPEESLVVSDGESMWIYDPGFGEAQRLPVGEQTLSGAAVNFLLGEGDLRREFEIALVSCDEAHAVLELRPRAPASYESLRVTADPRSGMLSHTRISDLLGNVTDLELTQLQTNVSPAPETFRFVAPEGVNVVELDPVEASRP
jgi:outer membrane lipoprotein carrier protein